LTWLLVKIPGISRFVTSSRSLSQIFDTKESDAYIRDRI